MLALPNGVTAEYGYDAASQLTSLTYKLGATTLGNITYTYDLSGNRTSQGNPLTPGQVHPGNRQNMQNVIGVAGTLGAGYLIYRAIRITSSVVLPPLWPTIPLNAAVP